jgi:hypothetical protein
MVDQASDVRSLKAPIESFLHTLSGSTIHVTPDTTRHARQSTSCPTIPVMPDNPCEAISVMPDNQRHARQSTSGPTIHVMPDLPRPSRQSTSLDLDNLLWYHGLWQHEPLKVISTCVRLRQPMLLAEDELALAQTNRLISKVELGPAHFTTCLSHLTCASQKLRAASHAQ